MAKMDSMIRVSVDYEHEGEFIARAQGRTRGSVLEEESVKSAVHRLWYFMEYSAEYMFENISATEIRLKCRSDKYSWVSIMVGEGMDRRELQVREKTIVFTGTSQELRPLHELLYWCHRFGGERYQGRLDTIVDILGEPEPLASSLLPLICLRECFHADHSKLHLFILEKHGVDRCTLKMLRGFIRQRGIEMEILAAGELWLENPMGMSYGQFLTYLFTTKSASKAA